MPDSSSLAQLLRLGSAQREDALLQAQMQQAAQAAQPRGRVYGTPGGAIMGALSDGLREMVGGFRQKDLQRGATDAERGRVDARQQWLSAALRGETPPAGAMPLEQSPQEQAAGMAAALRGEPAPGMLTQVAPYEPGGLLKASSGVSAPVRRALGTILPGAIASTASPGGLPEMGAGIPGTPAAPLAPFAGSAGQVGGSAPIGNALRAKMSAPAVAPGAAEARETPETTDAPNLSPEQYAELAIASGDPAMMAWGKTVLEQNNLRATLDAQQREAKAKAGAAKADAEEKAKGERFERALKLRQEFSKLPQTQAIVDVNTARQKVATATPDGAGDLSLVYGFMRLLDPGSSVKESEFNNAANTQGIPGQFLALRAKIFAEGMLDDRARRAIKREADTLYKAHYKSFEPTLKSYRGLADRYGFDLEEIIPELGLTAKTPAPRPAALMGPDGKRLVLQSDGTYLPEE